ncbi:MAG: uroporphyrinogen-III C-methyltransferase [Clostridiales bacterium]|nr:uroporphyrinogen-III C-methyltransferase [Clostridiales bacterium]
MIKKVYLVGAGPGDPDLITLKGRKCIKEADVLVYDRLVSQALLEERKPGCKLIYVGKENRNHVKPQDEINEILYQEAKAGKCVVRLKGGDPYVFGRGGEEGEYLYQRNIPFEVVPGVTSAIGGLAYAGIPITHREVSRSFHVITGHLKNQNEELDWEVLAKLKGTLVFLMGVTNLENITNNLIKHGMDKDTPAAMINWATTPRQRSISATLSTIYDVALEAKMTSPSLIVVGEVVSLKDTLDFYSKKPLFGKNIVITRGTGQRDDIIDKLRSLGANPISMPTIEIEEISPNNQLDQGIHNLDNYTYVVFTSINGVKIFFKRLFELGYDSRALAGLKIGAIGSNTKEAIREYGLNVDFMPTEYVGESLVSELKEEISESDKILIPRAESGRPFIVEELAKICKVDEVKTYKTVKSREDSSHIIDNLKELDSYYLLFSSPSTFKNFIEIAGQDANDLINKGRIISIGPITSRAIKDAGYPVFKQAKTYNYDGIIEMLLEDSLDE